MSRNLLIAATLLIVASEADAQFNSNFSVQTATYAPLSGATTINGTTIWDDENYKVPIGFTFNMNGISLTHFSLLEGQTASIDTTVTTAPVTGFTVIGADLWDRGNVAGSASLSPIRYQLSGTAPNRIFKVEVLNAGFYDEYDVFSTNNDGVSYQVWLYETTNVFEIHYGTSTISHAMTYFLPAGKPAVGFFKNLDISGSGSVDMFYYLKGDPANPTLDSTNNIITFNSGLNSYPVNGTVYKFTPKSLSVKDISEELANIEVYPNVCRDVLTIDTREHPLVTYQVVAMNGALTNMRGRLQKGKNVINVGNLAPGVYTLQMRSRDDSRVIRFTKL